MTDQPADEEKKITGSVIDFVRLREDTATQTKRRRVSRPQAKAKPPPPPNMRMAKVQKPRGGDLNAAMVHLDFDLGQSLLGRIFGLVGQLSCCELQLAQPTLHLVDRSRYARTLHCDSAGSFVDLIKGQVLPAGNGNQHTAGAGPVDHLCKVVL